MKRKITVTTGTRSEYGILHNILKKIDSNKNLELILIVAGMHFSKKHGNTWMQIINDGLKINAKVKMIPKGNTPYHMSKALGKGIIEFSEIFQKYIPDVNVILGDRDEALASALAASHMNIPNAHIHGGEKTQGIDEYNRHALTKISNFHFAATKKSQERIIKMGENPKNVIFTGSPSIDNIVEENFATKEEIELKYNLKFSGKQILLIQHPVTSQYKESKKQILNTLNAVVSLKHPIIVIAPNSDAGNKEIFDVLNEFKKKFKFIKLYPSIPRYDYLGLLNNCSILIGNSSSGLIEGEYFNMPVINIGIRQKGRERGVNVIDIENPSIDKIRKVVINSLKEKNKEKKSFMYGKGNASEKIVKFLEKVKIDETTIQKQILY